LPWVSITAAGYTVNGWQTAFGYNIDSGPVGGNFMIVLVLLGPLAVGYLLYQSFIQGGAMDKVLDVYGLIGIGGLVFLLLLWSPNGSGTPGGSLGLGWILCFLSAMALSAGGYLNLRQLGK
jgi:hypothetical protein